MEQLRKNHYSKLNNQKNTNFLKRKTDKSTRFTRNYHRPFLFEYSSSKLGAQVYQKNVVTSFLSPTRLTSFGALTSLSPVNPKAPVTPRLPSLSERLHCLRLLVQIIPTWKTRLDLPPSTAFSIPKQCPPLPWSAHTFLSLKTTYSTNSSDERPHTESCVQPTWEMTVQAGLCSLRIRHTTPGLRQGSC